jgi:hypothetical protein
MGHTGILVSGKTPNVHLENNRLFSRALKGPVTFPVVVVLLDKDGPHRRVTIITWLNSPTPLPQEIRHCACRRVEQYLPFVKPVTSPDCIAWAINTPAVTKIGWQAHYIYMPAEKRTICLFVEPDYLERLWAIGTLKK